MGAEIAGSSVSDASNDLSEAAAALQSAEVVQLPSRFQQAEPGPAPSPGPPTSSARPKARRGGGKPQDDAKDEGGKGRGRGAAPPPPAPPRGPRNGLGEACPVTPLGTQDGVYFYLDAVGQLRSLKARDHGNKDLLALFAPRTDFVHSTWPRMNRNGLTDGWRPELAAEELMNACAFQGVWNAFDRVRGRGAWRDAAGGLILHVGDKVLLDGEWRRTGMHDDFVYPAAPPVSRPMEGQAASVRMDELLALLKSWNWKRPELDPYLMLGWLGAAKVAGALHWRPLAWVTGDAGTGKSTLHALIKGLMGQGLLATSDATEAGIRQTLGNQTLPVAIDEAEADEDNRKLQSLIKLARQAASGGDITRGGADHSASRFQARSCFLLSSILIPPLKSQDRSRLAILDLKPLPIGGTEPKLEADWMGEMGAIMGRRMLDGWARFDATLRTYRTMLQQVGHGGRGADQFGTLLACMDLLLADTIPRPEDAGQWASLLAVNSLSETSNNLGEAERCLAYLLTSSVALDGGGRPQTVAYWVDRASADLDAHFLGLETTDVNNAAEKALANIGMRVQRRKADGSKWLAVAVAHQGLTRIFAGSHWQASSGANGVWGQALARLPDADDDANVRITKKQTKCVRLPLLLALQEGPEEDF